MKVNIGKNTLGDSDKMSVSLREYGRPEPGESMQNCGRSIWQSH